MKKTFFVALLATALFACSTPAETKVEATTGTTSVTTEGADVELMKKAAESWASGNWDAYLSSYIDTFKKSREGMDGNVTIDNSIYEVVTMADGSKYGHAWLNCSWKTKDGGTSKTLIFNSYSIKDGKFTTEWPIYDTKEFDKLLK